MKKVWAEIKLEFACAILDMWSFMNKYVFTHNKSFNKRIRKFVWNMHMRWLERTLALYNKMEFYD